MATKLPADPTAEPLPANGRSALPSAAPGASNGGGSEVGVREVVVDVHTPTVGVEEEFALLDPLTGRVALVAEDVIAACADAEGVSPESMRYMVETRTPTSMSLSGVLSSLEARRACVAREARRLGTLMVSSGVAPFGVPAPPALTPNPRYQELLDTFPSAMRTTGTCACHVHVGVDDREDRVEVVGRLRPWLPALIAVTANSPIWQGRDVGWASARHVFVTRWPTASPAPDVHSAADYDERVREAVARGEALDERSVYFLARLSPRYPTVEIRAADACLTVDEAVAYAGLVRAAVGHALSEVAEGRPETAIPQDRLMESCREAARSGLSGRILDPATGHEVPMWARVDDLVATVLPELTRFGDADRVLSTVDRWRAEGSGADRQRRMYLESDGAQDFVRRLAEASMTRFAA